MKLSSYLIILLVSLLSFQSNAQIFNRILDRTQDKLSREIENRIVERISDEITRAAMKPVDKAIDDMLRERYVQDSIDGKTTHRNYDDFVTAFMVPVDLPPSYEFDMELKCETKEYDGEKSKMDMLLRKDGAYIGITQYEKDAKTMMVFDMTNDIMAVYSEDKEGKKVMALPSMLSAAQAINNGQYTADKDEDAYKVTVKKTGKTKKILGYKCDEWETDEEATTTKTYVSEDFPISWRESFSQFLKELLPTTQRDQMPEGMFLKSETKTKKKNKKSTFEVKKIIEDPKQIDNSEYEQTSYQDY
ncbi:MAG: DUF4412 domain-containing protein [Bacteroidota bacterium]